MTVMVPDPLASLVKHVRAGKALTVEEGGAVLWLVTLLHDERRLTTFLEPIFTKTSPTYGRQFAEHAAKNLREGIVGALALEEISHAVDASQSQHDDAHARHRRRS